MSLTRQVVLASTSPYRRALLARFNLSFDCAAPHYEELNLGLGPEETARRHAHGKAVSLACDFPQALIIGADQLLADDEGILGKPGTHARAMAQLSRLQGRSHRLITAVCVYDAAKDASHEDLDVHTLQMRSLSAAHIDRYLRLDQPYDCAGSYKLEEHGLLLFEGINGGDDSAIIGLPLLRTLKLLRACGLDPLQE